MTERLTCDVAVIGAGPAGSTTARVVAEAGVRVLLLERKAQVGIPEQCAGYVSSAIRWHVRLPEGCIAQSVDRLRTHLPDGSVHEAQVPGYTIHRDALDRHLATLAVQAGARLLIRTTARGRCDSGILAHSKGQELRIEAKAVIGADGPFSIVARWMGLPTPRLARALQYELPLRCSHRSADVYFRPAFRGGYAWLFPAGGIARVGAAALDKDGEPEDGLRQLIAELQSSGIVDRSALAFTAGHVPVSGSAGLVRDNMLLVGDAAGHTHPITGAGILNAIIAGEMAGRATATAVREGDLGLLKEYEDEWREVMGPSQEWALARRIRMDDAWGYPQEMLQAIKESWITFDEYYRG
ncbi:MAG: NAD(P)/FAD-dependent oxidoreductase [Chloroflexi bacterium]|nr:NAD(P)/FAD-dependent oxidoreductase [Chloroflexota bacterium]